MYHQKIGAPISELRQHPSRKSTGTVHAKTNAQQQTNYNQGHMYETPLANLT